MERLEILLTNVIGMHLQAKNYSKIWEALIADRSLFPALINSAQTEDEIIAFLDYYGPTDEEPDEVIDATDLSYICEELLPLAYEMQWYKLCGFIYAIGYESFSDPVCGDQHPLVYGGKEHNFAFVDAYITGQKRFDNLSFDGMDRSDGRCRTIPEALVDSDCVEVVALCLQNGLNPNAFAYDGRRIVEVSRSEKMTELLLAHGAKSATPQERNLVLAVNELRYDFLRWKTMNALLSAEPLLKLSYFNGNTTRSEEQEYNIVFEAASNCRADLIEALYPYIHGKLDDKQSEELLRVVLGFSPWGRQILDDRTPVDMAATLEVLYSLGMTYGEENATLSENHPFIGLVSCVCSTFSFLEPVDLAVQMRVFSALWKMGGSPWGDGIKNALTRLADKHPFTDLNVFIWRTKQIVEEE